MGNRRRYSRDELTRILAKTRGYCHLCPKGPYTLDDYGEKWQVEHSTPLSEDGVDDFRNWYVACVPCNQAKGVSNSASFRREMGVEGVPFSTAESKKHSARGCIGIPALCVLFGLSYVGFTAMVEGPEHFSLSGSVTIVLCSLFGGIVLAVFNRWFLFNTRGREGVPRNDK
ncbi:hypothetical protein PLCT2_00060 [Planctomycetaceae bacterium]|nr:hypothetical protein PLCT2_00060 [Planctomycetaceae bacterium]